jgi:hypothetical protein
VPPVPGGLGDFCQRPYHLACLFVRLLCRDNSYIARLCACYRYLKTNENPAQSGTFFSGNRLKTSASAISSLPTTGARWGTRRGSTEKLRKPRPTSSLIVRGIWPSRPQSWTRSSPSPAQRAPSRSNNISHPSASKRAANSGALGEAGGPPTACYGPGRGGRYAGQGASRILWAFPRATVRTVPQGPVGSQDEYG